MTSQSGASRATGAFAVIVNMKIRAKIFLAFGVLIGIMAISSGISVVSFSTTSELFHDYEEVGNLATAAQEVERELAELDQHVEQYAATGDQAQHDKVLEMEKALGAQVEHAKTLATNDEERAEIAAIAAAFEHIVTGFEKASTIEHERARLAHEVLDVAGPKLAADLEGIALKAAKEGNSNAVIMANAALYEAMKARLNANLVLARHEKGKAEDAETAFHGLGKALAQLEKVTGASAYKADVADAKALGRNTKRRSRRARRWTSNSPKSSKPRFSSRARKRSRRRRRSRPRPPSARARTAKPCPPPSSAANSSSLPSA